jgi:hypothetical protein
MNQNLIHFVILLENLRLLYFIIKKNDNNTLFCFYTLKLFVLIKLIFVYNISITFIMMI